jgi:hypothetical protein
MTFAVDDRDPSRLADWRTGRRRYRLTLVVHDLRTQTGSINGRQTGKVLRHLPGLQRWRCCWRVPASRYAVAARLHARGRFDCVSRLGPPREIPPMVMRQSIALTLAGIAAGLGGAMLTTR